ncbi:hypothetical protein POM88_032176 [Heracleum sosnowskyi]|uniref:Uncharacterized protein n=1 Tax=Heracleum sosnowskyi TaxID=360622 RepID=A0AAD8HZM4_9APIA|nr:hypothetical protein POM88_032176 [Heracleum sosnowskyi]
MSTPHAQGSGLRAQGSAYSLRQCSRLRLRKKGLLYFLNPHKYTRHPYYVSMVVLSSLVLLALGTSKSQGLIILLKVSDSLHISSAAINLKFSILIFKATRHLLI